MQSATEIVAAVKERGDFEGWTPEQVVARNVVKLAEEVCEAVNAARIGAPFGLTTPGVVKLDKAATVLWAIAREVFDGKDYLRPTDGAMIIGELHDVYVVLCVLEAKLRECGYDVDIAAGALEKATSDVGRYEQFLNN